ncbi:MAG: hypothetical protein KDB65_08205 [Calditrichaeota bacterium]|nr:hypothetical protein [Calditrichota bacterium]MCB9369892.1 hypothetical protein [Calditrichota bacterium]
MKKTLILLFLPALLFAQSSSEHFTITKSVLDAGGGTSSSETFGLVSSFGQLTPIGVQSSENFTLYAGFLTPSLGVSPLSPVQDLTIKDSGIDAILRWTAIPGAGSYSIYRDTAVEFVPGPGNLLAVIPAPGTEYVDSNVLGGPELQQYYIIVVNAP